MEKVLLLLTADFCSSADTALLDQITFKGPFQPSFEYPQQLQSRPKASCLSFSLSANSNPLQALEQLPSKPPSAEEKALQHHAGHRRLAMMELFQQQVKCPTARASGDQKPCSNGAASNFQQWLQSNSSEIILAS